MLCDGLGVAKSACEAAGCDGTTAAAALGAAPCGGPAPCARLADAERAFHRMFGYIGSGEPARERGLACAGLADWLLLGRAEAEPALGRFDDEPPLDESDGFDCRAFPSSGKRRYSPGGQISMLDGEPS